jgi:cell wall-associated NlpC family hydrolase
MLAVLAGIGVAAAVLFSGGGPSTALTAAKTSAATSSPASPGTGATSLAGSSAYAHVPTGKEAATGGQTGSIAGKHPKASSDQALAGGSAKAVAVAEVRDPEEAKSFPLPASVHHRSASTPSVAGEAAIAAGAASDAQVRKELGEEEHAKAEEKAAQRRVLTPVAGGFSVGGNGTIPIPTDVPEAVQRVIAGGNAIADFPYIWGGGHGSFIANGYDCSGSVSYALAAGGLLSAPLVSGDLGSWGEPGPGRWITIYANAGHTFMNVDGMWFDTAGRSGPYASRWLVSQPSLSGYAVRHPPGL